LIKIKYKSFYIRKEEKMKSLAELQAIKDRMKNKVVLREGLGELRVVVGMATCGIAAGARPVLNAFVEEVNNADLADKVSVTQTGCAGLCQLEPIVEVYEAGKEKVTYIKMTADKAKEVVEKHLKGGKVVTEYTVAGAN
jgi:NADP-reducing hydrogenase subunit HndB